MVLAINIAHFRSFTDETLLQGFRDFLEEHNLPNMAIESAKREIRCLKRSYTPSKSAERKGYQEDLLDCPLAELGLLRESDISGLYTLQIGPHTNLPLGIFAYSIFRYRSHQEFTASTLSLDELRWGIGSPGRVYCLDNNAILDMTERLEQETGLIQLVRSEGISQIAFQKEYTPTEILNKYYTDSLVDKP